VFLIDGCVVRYFLSKAQRLRFFGFSSTQVNYTNHAKNSITARVGVTTNFVPNKLEILIKKIEL
jgi:hypothetical protein